MESCSFVGSQGETAVRLQTMRGALKSALGPCPCSFLEQNKQFNVRAGGSAKLYIGAQVAVSLSVLVLAPFSS